MRRHGRRRKLIAVLAVAVMAAVLLAQPGCGPAGEGDFNLIFRYGLGKKIKNELNTFRDTFTRDMVVDPPLKISMPLSEEEKDSIYQKMLEIGFFDYPDEFVVRPEGDIVSIVTPYMGYYFKVRYGPETKELEWEDEIQNDNEDADKLRALITLIRDIIRSREEYQNLPQPGGAYQ